MLDEALPVAPHLIKNLVKYFMHRFLMYLYVTYPNDKHGPFRR
jgi:hypothetical protein